MDVDVLSDSMGSLSISKDFTVSIETVEEILSMMKSTSISQLSVFELVEKLQMCSIDKENKTKERSIPGNSSISETNVAEPVTSEILESAPFSFNNLCLNEAQLPFSPPKKIFDSKFKNSSVNCPIDGNPMSEPAINTTSIPFLPTKSHESAAFTFALPTGVKTIVHEAGIKPVDFSTPLKDPTSETAFDQSKLFMSPATDFAIGRENVNPKNVTARVRSTSKKINNRGFSGFQSPSEKMTMFKSAVFGDMTNSQGTHASSDTFSLFPPAPPPPSTPSIGIPTPSIDKSNPMDRQPDVISMHVDSDSDEEEKMDDTFGNNVFKSYDSQSIPPGTFPMKSSINTSSFSGFPTPSKSSESFVANETVPKLFNLGSSTKPKPRTPGKKQSRSQLKASNFSSTGATPSTGPTPQRTKAVPTVDFDSIPDMTSSLSDNVLFGNFWGQSKPSLNDSAPAWWGDSNSTIPLDPFTERFAGSKNGANPSSFDVDLTSEPIANYSNPNDDNDSIFFSSAHTKLNLDKDSSTGSDDQNNSEYNSEADSQSIPLETFNDFFTNVFESAPPGFSFPQPGDSKPMSRSNLSPTKMRDNLVQPSNDESQNKKEETQSPQFTASPSKSKTSAKTTAVNGEKDSIDPDELQSSAAESFRKRGRDLYNAEDYSSACEVFTRALNIAPKNWSLRAAVLGNRAASYMMLDQHHEAIVDCDQALLIDPTSIKLVGRKGRALLRLGELEAAYTAFAKVDSYFFDRETTSAAMIKEFESAKVDARSYLKTVKTAQTNLKMMSSFESQFAHDATLQIAEELMQTCPSFHIVHVAKANALINLQRWRLAKEFIEAIIESAPPSLLALHCHSKATAPTPSRESLVWTESGLNNTVSVNHEAVINAVLFMGTELGALYVICLKNLEQSRSCCADVMEKVSSIVSTLLKRIGTAAVEFRWKWVQSELLIIQQLISRKNQADKMFRLGRYHEAIHHYTEAIETDPKAIRWGAILHSNRAATYMSMSFYNEAVTDCNESIKKDDNYVKAYLRRARAYRGLNQHAASVRDYQFYLETRPTPVDKRDVQQELNKMIDDKKAQTKKEAGANNYYFRKEQQKNSSSSSSNTAPPPPPPNFKHPSYKPQYPPRPSPAYASSSHGAGKFSWQDEGEDEEDGSEGDSEGDRFQYFKNYTDFYSKRNGYTGDGNSSAGGSGSYSGTGANGCKQDSKPKPDPRHDFKKDTSSSYNNSSSSSRSRQQENQQPPPPPPKGNRSGGPGSGGNSNSSNYNGQKGGARRPVSDDDDGHDHYKILGISSHATEREVKTAYRKLALQYHPDKNKEPGAEEKFKTFTGSYAILSDKTLRMRYDLTRPY